MQYRFLKGIGPQKYKEQMQSAPAPDSISSVESIPGELLLSRAHFRFDSIANFKTLNYIYKLLKKAATYPKIDFTISDILRDLKKFTSKQIFNAIKANPKESRKEWMIYMFERAGKRKRNNKDFQFWQRDNHPIELSSRECLSKKWIICMRIQ